jgi:hypothetical protein
MHEPYVRDHDFIFVLRYIKNSVRENTTSCLAQKIYNFLKRKKSARSKITTTTRDQALDPRLSLALCLRFFEPHFLHFIRPFLTLSGWALILALQRMQMKTLRNRRLLAASMIFFGMKTTNGK